MQEAPLPGVRVLLVEDQPVNQKVIGRMLERLGCVVELAEDGEAGVELARRRPALVLMDCSMPLCDGYEATRRIRALPDGLARVPIVALTAHATAADRANCLAVGMDDWMTKPVQPEVVVAMLERYTSWARPRAAEPVVEIVDPVVVGRLLALAGPDDPDFFQDLVVDFRTVAESALVEARTLHREDRLADVRRALHRLRSASATIGAARLREVCARFEAASDEELHAEGTAFFQAAEREARLAAGALAASYGAAA